MRLMLALTCLFLTPALAAKCLGNYPAPDKSTSVRVSALNKSHESLIQFFDFHNKLLYEKDYSSADMEHGSVISNCAWTPNSKFFVYSSYSSGGHQAWHFETTFYAREQNKLYELDDFVGPVTDPDFSVTAPDLIQTIGWVSNKNLVQIIRPVLFDPSSDAPNFEYRVHLSKLLILAQTSKLK